MVLVGNKLDLAESSRVVSQADGAALADELGVQHVETSARDGQGVHDAFGLLVDIVLDKCLASLQSGTSSDPIVARAADSRASTALKPQSQANSCSC